MKNNKEYIYLWISQFVSQFGSQLTSFAMVIWVYNETKSEMSMSLLAFFSYLPYVLIGVFAGSIVDRFKKKNIILICDMIAAICSLIILLLVRNGLLMVYHLYILNSIISFMNAFQAPASSVLIGMIVPKDKYSNVSGMNSLSNSVIAILHPIIATTILSLFGIKMILIIDIISFFIGEIIIFFFIKNDEIINNNEKIKKVKKIKINEIIKETVEGTNFLFKDKGILYIIISFAIMNLLSNLTYENILPAMILSRTNNDNNILGIVSGTIGIGGIIGGFIVTFLKLPKNKIKIIFLGSAFSFLFGDITMGIGQDIVMWIIGAGLASFPISFIMAAQMEILYYKIPKNIQGRVFAVRNSIQYCTIPVGLLLGGFLAEYVFEPFMKRDISIVYLLNRIVGSGDGSGMGLMFICTGILGSISSIILYKTKYIRKLEEEYQKC